MDPGNFAVDLFFVLLSVTCAAGAGQGGGGGGAGAVVRGEEQCRGRRIAVGAGLDVRAGRGRLRAHTERRALLRCVGPSENGVVRLQRLLPQARPLRWNLQFRQYCCYH